MKFTFAFLMLLSSFAHASNVTGVTVYNKPSSSLTFSDYLSRFEVNPDLGRARLSIAMEDLVTEYPSVVYEKVLVDGLTYNTSTGEVVYQNPVTGARTVCAQAKKPQSGKGLKSTKLCTLAPTKYILKYDDGYEIKEIEYLKIDLVMSE
jgi:hypothetical protein